MFMPYVYFTHPMSYTFFKAPLWKDVKMFSLRKVIKMSELLSFFSKAYQIKLIPYSTLVQSFVLMKLKRF